MKTFVSTLLAIAFSSALVVCGMPMHNGPKMNRVAGDLLEKILDDETLSQNAEMISFSEDGSSVRLVRGLLSEPLKGDLVPAAKAYLMEHAAQFNIPAHKGTEVLHLIRNDSVNGTDHLGFQMALAGIPVHDARIDVHVGADRRITMITGSFPTVDSIENTWTLSADEAAAKATAVIGIKNLRSEPKVEPIIFAANGSGRVAHLVSLPSEEPLGDFESVIDAATGVELSRTNQMQFLSGRGSVYQLNPLKSAVTVEELPYLNGNSPTGAYANVVNEDGASAVSANREFIFDQANTHFDEINAYYHINRIHDFFKQFGFNKMDRSLKVVVHYGTALDRAFYSPQDDMIALGDGSKLQDLAKDETVLYHEYSHATLRTILSLTHGGESGAINEGQADYFACSLSGEPKVGQWAASKKPGDYLRKIDNVLHYPEAMAYEIHADGRIWGGACWDLRKALGPQVADRLIHRSLFYTKAPDAMFFDGYQAVLAADKEISNGANSATIKQIFDARGISKAPTLGPVFERADLEQLRRFRTMHELKTVH